MAGECAPADDAHSPRALMPIAAVSATWRAEPHPLSEIGDTVIVLEPLVTARPSLIVTVVFPTGIAYGDAIDQLSERQDPLALIHRPYLLSQAQGCLRAHSVWTEML